MKPHPDHPDLTAYALGEAEATHVADWLHDPRYSQEVDSIGDLALHLQATAPLPTARLHPDQRSAVMTPPERVRRLVEATRVKEQPRAQTLLPFFFGTVKWAAAAALVAASTQVGLQIVKPLQDTATAQTPSTTTLPTPVARPKEASPQLVSTEQPQPLSPPKPKPSAPSAVQKATPTLVVAKVEPPQTSVAKQPAAPAMQTLLVAAPAQDTARPSVSFSFSSMVSTSRTTADSSSVKPADLLKIRSSGPLSAAPLRSTPASNNEPAKKERPAPLMLHAWSADVIAAPWQPELRLLRVALQLPSDQARREDCALEVNFDPNAVRSFRQLGQRVLPGTTSESAAHVVTWYEVQPNGATGTSSAARLLGTAQLADAKFTTSTMAPFDGNSLRIMDRGLSVDEAKADFRYEAALIGFGQLVNGASTGPRPALSQLLSLAQSAQQESDPSGERGRLAKVLREAAELAGQQP